ncbi:ROK family protein, partial [Streptomyces sp. A7024]|nr:ROK family protein [Streptomyces coryli]
MNILGVDIGGSGIKGAPADLDRGDLAEERHKVLTPQPSKPDAVAESVAEVAEHFGWAG